MLPLSSWRGPHRTGSPAPFRFVAPFKSAPAGLDDSPVCCPFQVRAPSLHRRATSSSRGRRPAHAATTTTAGSAADGDVGRSPPRRGAQAPDPSPTERPAPMPPRTPGRLSGTRHSARAPEHPIAPPGTNICRRPRRHRTFIYRALSRAPLLGAGRSRPPDRRSRRHPPPLAWHRRAQDSRGARDQSRPRATRRDLGRSLSRPRPPDAVRGPSGTDLRPAQLEEAHSQRARARRAVVRGLVRRVGGTARATSRKQSCRRASNVVSGRRLAPPHRRSIAQKRGPPGLARGLCDMNRRRWRWTTCWRSFSEAAAARVCFRSR